MPRWRLGLASRAPAGASREEEEGFGQETRCFSAKICFRNGNYPRSKFANSNQVLYAMTIINTLYLYVKNDHHYCVTNQMMLARRIKCVAMTMGREGFCKSVCNGIDYSLAFK